MPAEQTLTLTERRRANMAKARKTLANSFESEEAKKEYYASIGRKGRKAQIVLALNEEERQALVSVYGLLARVAARANLDLSDAEERTAGMVME